VCLVVSGLLCATKSTKSAKSTKSTKSARCLGGARTGTLVSMPIGCLAEQGVVQPIRAERTYAASYNRAVDHVHYLAHYRTPKVQLHSVVRDRRRPWDAPPRQLNELGPGGYNFFRVAQSDEQRIWHEEQLAQARRSPKIRLKEANDAHGNVHQRGMHRVPPSKLHPSMMTFAGMREDKPPSRGS